MHDNDESSVAKYCFTCYVYQNTRHRKGKNEVTFQHNSAENTWNEAMLSTCFIVTNASTIRNISSSDSSTTRHCLYLEFAHIKHHIPSKLGFRNDAVFKDQPMERYTLTRQFWAERRLNFAACFTGYNPALHLHFWGHPSKSKLLAVVKSWLYGELHWRVVQRVTWNASY